MPITTSRIKIILICFVKNGYWKLETGNWKLEIGIWNLKKNEKWCFSDNAISISLKGKSRKLLTEITTHINNYLPDWLNRHKKVLKSATR
jgi:hypothetical protein